MIYAYACVSSTTVNLYDAYTVTAPVYRRCNALPNPGATLYNLC